jgi:hypothetical protein
MQLETNRENTKLAKVSKAALLCCDFDLFMNNSWNATYETETGTHVHSVLPNWIDGKTPGTADPSLKNRILCSECNTGTENRAAAILLIGLWR